MRALCRSSAVWLAAAVCLANDAKLFVGDWILVEAESQLAWMPDPPEKRLSIEIVSGIVKAGSLAFTTDGKSSKTATGGMTYSTAAKWEGAALIVNSIAGGNRQFVLMDRWRLSLGGNKLTIRRQISRGSGETESTLVYLREGAFPGGPSAPEAPPTPVPARTASRSYVVPAGTRLPLRLMQTLNTKTAAEGDRVLLETTFPISVDGRIVIPAGTQVNATLTEAKRPGRVKGRAQLYIRFDTIILDNGTTRDFRARLSGAEPGSGKVDRGEGGIEGDGDKAGDAGTVGKTTAAGAGIGTVVGSATGNPGLGTAVGAAAGAAAGLGRVLGSRGPDIDMAKGAAIEMVLDRPLLFTAAELP